jgi:hypothetical protein
MPLAAIDCVRRGTASLRANWELVLAQWLATLIVVTLTLAGIVPVLAALGLLDFSTLPSTLPDVEGWLRDLGARLGEVGPTLVAALAGTLTIWTLAFLAHCFFQGGIYGVLAAAERQAPGGVPRDHRLFRTFSWRDLFGWGGRNLWRFFWLYNLFGAIFLLIVLGGALLAVMAVAAGDRWGGAAAVGIGCGGALPLFFAAVVLGLWLVLAQADLGQEDSGVGIAARRGWRVLTRRLGAVLLICLLAAIASLAVGLVFAPFDIGLQMAAADNLALKIGLRLGLELVQALVAGIPSIALAGSFVALVRTEAAERPA